MKKFILLPLLTILFVPVAAQNWVTIPDANFANKLNELFPECMDGNQLNTTCPAILSTTYLDVSYEGISDLTGVQYFINLEYLGCVLNGLTYMPDLPVSLTYLNCRGNLLTALPELPPSLDHLDCQINALTTLPELPPSLDTLICLDNELNELPDLPPSLKVLDCAGNNLEQLPDLPNSMVQLDCEENNLSVLPELPVSLTILRCGDNILVELPELPTILEALVCENNQLTCLPILPSSLTFNFASYFNISNNSFTCLPNYVPAMSGANAEWLEYPLCNLSDVEENPYGCSGLDGIAGTVFNDSNANCALEEAEDGLINVPIILINNEDDPLTTTLSISSGRYNFTADLGTYSVQLDSENLPFQPSCDDTGGSQEVILTVDEPSALGVDFGVECVPNYDLGTQSVATTGLVFPGQEYEVSIAAGDLSSWYGLQCAAGFSGSVTVNISGPVSYIEPAENALVPNVSGDLQLIYEIEDFGDIDFEESFGVILETDTTAQAEDLVCIEVIVEPIDDDANPENNVYTHCYSVVNSYDPNIKQVWPQDVEPGYDGYFNYTIFFQNTGTAPAFNIRVADTLDTNLDLSTFEVTGYSHPCLTYVSGNVTTFRFNNIMLPDSTSDFDGSIGYVQYRIKAVEDLPVGTIIENTAHIFFDFNDAIVTNTTQNEFVIDTSVDQLQLQLAKVFPNPGTGQFNVLFSGSKTGITHLEVYNLGGQRVFQQQVNENRAVLDLTDYPSGMYLLHIRNERGSEAVKLLKQ